MTIRNGRFYIIYTAALLIVCMMSFTAMAQQPSTSTDMQVLEAFNQQDAEEGKAVKISDKEKHIILFLMGISLLVLLLSTVTVGVIMGVYGKPLFVPHMILAGFSVTLAIAHSIAAIVWFYPF